MAQKIPVPHAEDHQTWDTHKKGELRWIFNKLEVALRQNLHAGPAGTAPEKDGFYVFRPTYNPYGMGVGAEKFFYSKSMYNQIIEYDFVPPGHFWCEWLDGPHLSIDYQKYDNGAWQTESVWEGKHESEDNLAKFSSWKKLDLDVAPSPYLWGNLLPWLKTRQDTINGFNIETRSGKIIEVHLRLGNDLFEQYPVGTTLIPIWENQEEPKENFLPNALEDMDIVYEKQYLKGKRKGFRLVLPQ